MLTSYKEVVKHLLEKYATDYIIAEAYTEIERFTESTNVSSLQDADALWMKTIWGQQVHDEYVLKRTWLEGLPSSIDI